jgi:hypothetical protein
MKKHVTLLCRGKSLDAIKLVPNVSHCVLVNSFHLELKKLEVHKYVKNCSTITHILSLAAYYPQHGANEIYSKYNFDKIVLPYVQEVRPAGNINVGLPIECLSDKNKDDMISTRRYKYTSPSSGMDALLYCVNDLNAKTVNMVGMDFYDNVGYFTNSYGRHDGENNTESVMKRMQGSDHDMIHMKKFFYKFIENHKDVQFNLWTYANMENRDNLLIKEL